MTVADDLIRPFQIESAGIRGRLVRLGPAVHGILTRHDYPAVVGGMLGQALALSSVLAGALKFDGVFTLQTKGDGPVPLLVADFRSPGHLRGYAQFDAAALEDLAGQADLSAASVPRLLGAGYIAFTVDQGGDMDRYQGIVALEGATLADCAHNYFRESEQIDSAIRLAAAPVTGPDGTIAWRAGALMLQRLPEGDPGMIARGAEPERDEVSEEDWHRAVVLLSSVRDEELLDPVLDPDQLLYRIYHEDGVRVFDPVALHDACPCSEKRAHDMLTCLPPAELIDLADDNRLIVTCEFCSEAYVFALEDFVPQA